MPILPFAYLINALAVFSSLGAQAFSLKYILVMGTEHAALRPEQICSWQEALQEESSIFPPHVTLMGI